jgi:cyclopropane-fatty-acyl-phospholipid synthase
VLRRPGALRRALLPPSQLALGEAYLRDDVDVEGDLEAASGLVDGLSAQLLSPATQAALLPHLLRLPADDLPKSGSGDSRPAPVLAGPRHSRVRDAAAVRAHYDVGNDFYALWLDRRMVYSCAYFETGAEDLDAAQEAKLEHLCRKLRLRPGEQLLDIGCGWGGLMRYAAERYGVRATGVTLSEPQAALARERIAAAGLGDRCRVEVRDYRDLPPEPGFDKVVSVGMVEHVGRGQLGAYFGRVHRLTRPGGLFLNQGIVAGPAGRPRGPVDRAARWLWREGAFIQRHVFPDGELATPGETIRRAEATGFETRDLESLREHYALTLRHWVRRLEARSTEATALVGERTYRVWRLYMAGFAQGFASARVGVVQLLLAKPDRNGGCTLPLSRRDLYRAPSTGRDHDGLASMLATPTATAGVSR